MNTLLTRTALGDNFYIIPLSMFCLLSVRGVDTTASIEISLVGCLIIFFARTGIEISLDHRHYRKYYALFSWRVGRWQLVPPITGITVKQFTYGGGNTPNWGVWNSKIRSIKMIIVMLSLQHESVGIILKQFYWEDMDEALVFAREVAGVFDVEINEYLSRD